MVTGTKPVFAEAADEHHVVGPAAFLAFSGPGRAAAGVVRRQMRDQRRAAEGHRLAVTEHPVDRMRLAAWLDVLKRGHILVHRHHLGAGQLLDQSVAFLVIAVGMAAEQDLDIGELEAQIGRPTSGSPGRSARRCC